MDNKRSGRGGFALSFMLALLGFSFSVYTWYQLLPLQRARVIFLENSIITHNSKEEGDPTPPFDNLRPIIKNIGKSPASNVTFKIYGMYFDENSKFLYSNTNCMEFFSDQLIHDLDPGTESQFGSFNIPLIFLQNEQRMQGMQQIVIVFIMTYEDGFGSTKSNRYLLFQYTTQTNAFSSLLFNDSIKTHQRLISCLNEYGVSKEHISNLSKLLNIKSATLNNDPIPKKITSDYLMFNQILIYQTLKNRF